MGCEGSVLYCLYGGSGADWRVQVESVTEEISDSYPIDRPLCFIREISLDTYPTAGAQFHLALVLIQLSSSLFFS